MGLSLCYWGRAVALSVCTLMVWTSSAFADHVLITRHFSGIWDQPDHQSQGLVLQIASEEDDSKLGVAYWFTFGDDLLSSWYLGVGPVDGHAIHMTLYQAGGIGFLEVGQAGDANVEEVGTLTLEFHNCNQGRAIFDTPGDVLGAGEFRIKRLTSIYRSRCSGGISDDTPAHARPTHMVVGLHSVRDDIGGKGKGMFWERSGRSDFKVEVEDMPDGAYDLEVCGDNRGSFEVLAGEGGIEYRSPGVDSKALLNFDPRDCLIEVLDGKGVALTSGDALLVKKARGPKDPETGQARIEVKLTNTMVLPDAKGKARYKKAGNNTEFSVQLEHVPVGSYPLLVGGGEKGQIEVTEAVGKFEGKLKFGNPQKNNTSMLNFDPRGQVIEVLQGATVILETLFPDE